MITDINTKDPYKQSTKQERYKATPRNANLTKAKITESDTRYHYELKIPGYIKDDFRFYISGNKLVVTTAKKDNIEESSKEIYPKHSYCYPSALFKCEFSLPKNVVRNKITMDYKNEVLSFNLFKT